MKDYLAADHNRFHVLFSPAYFVAAAGILAFAGIFLVFSKGEAQSAPALTVISPNGGERFVAGETYELKWEQNRDFSQGGGTYDFFTLEACRDQNCETIGNVPYPQQSGISLSYFWAIPASFATANDFRLRVTDNNGNRLGAPGIRSSDESDAVFSIVASTEEGMAPSIQNGDLVRCSLCAEWWKVFIVTKIGTKTYLRHVVHADIFSFYPHLGGRNWLSRVKMITTAEWFSPPTAHSLHWVKSATDDKIYEINADGTRHWMRMSWEDFARLTGGVYAIINDRELGWYTSGADRLP